jgi:hypothetical protein
MNKPRTKTTEANRKANRIADAELQFIEALEQDIANGLCNNTDATIARLMEEKHGIPAKNTLIAFATDMAGRETTFESILRAYNMKG